MPTNTKEVSQNEDEWIKNKDKQLSTEPDETFRHTFDNTTVKFGVFFVSEGKTVIKFNYEPTDLVDSSKVNFDGNIDTAKRLVENTVKNFDRRKDIDMLDISKHLASQILELYQEKQSEDVWIKNENKRFSSDPDETLRRTFDKTTVKFTLHEEDEKTLVKFGTEPDGNRLQVTINDNPDTAKRLVENTVKHFSGEKDFSILDISKHLNSQSMELRQEAAIKNPSDLMLQQVKKAGYVQGVCECVAAIGDDHALGKKLLVEMNVTKDMAKKYANPETYKSLEQGIFAPQQKLDQTRGIKR